MPATAKPAPRTRLRLKKNDTVLVIAGKDAGKRGRVLDIDRKKGRILVEHAMMIKKHVRPNPARQIKGGIAEREAPIHASNVMVICGECGKRTRIGSKAMGDGTRVRVCRHCQGVLDK